MRHIETKIVIATSPETIWKVLMDFDQFPKWNPFMKSIQGEKAVGKQLVVKIQPPNSKGMTFKPTILTCNENEEFRWLGKLGIKGIFDGEHYFRLEPQGDATTKFVHGEKFSGVLVGLMGKALDKTRDGFQLMNEALKVRCE